MDGDVLPEKGRLPSDKSAPFYAAHLLHMYNVLTMPGMCMQRDLGDLTVGFDDLAAEKAQLLQEMEQLLAQLEDADKAGLEAETLLQASTAKIETLEKARNAAVQASIISSPAVLSFASSYPSKSWTNAHSHPTHCMLALLCIQHA